MTSSTSAVAKCVAIEVIGFGPSTNAVSGRSMRKNTERLMRAMRLRSLPRATKYATSVFTNAKTYAISARLSYFPVNHAGPPGYTPSKMPSTTKRPDAMSMRMTTGRSAPATSGAPFHERRWYPLRVLAARLQRGDRLGRHENAAEVRPMLAAAVKIAATGRDQSVRLREPEELRRRSRGSFAVIPLDPGQACRDQTRQQLFEAEHGPRMRERGHTAVGAHELDGFERRQADARNVRRRILRDERVERVVVALHVALLEERLREVRPAERAALRDLEHPRERDRVAERVQLLDHERDAAAAVLAQPAQAVLERRVRGIDEVAEDVDVAPLGLGVQLGRWDHTHAERGALDRKSTRLNSSHVPTSHAAFCFQQ